MAHGAEIAEGLIDIVFVRKIEAKARNEWTITASSRIMLKKSSEKSRLRKFDAVHRAIMGALPTDPFFSHGADVALANRITAARWTG